MGGVTVAINQSQGILVAVASGGHKRCAVDECLPVNSAQHSAVVGQLDLVALAVAVKVPHRVGVICAGVVQVKHKNVIATQAPQVVGAAAAVKHVGTGAVAVVVDAQ